MEVTFTYYARHREEIDIQDALQVTQSKDKKYTYITTEKDNRLEVYYTEQMTNFKVYL